MIEVFVADERDVVRRGFGQIIDAAPGLRVVGEASNASQARRRVHLLHPHVLVGDPDLLGAVLGLAAAVSGDGGPLLAVIVHLDGQDDLIASADGGVPVSGTETAEQLVRLIKRVALGRIRASIRMTLVPQSRSADDPRISSLSRRESDVLSLMAMGKTNREAAEELGLSEKTVKNYASTLFVKLGVQHRTEAILVKFSADGLADGQGRLTTVLAPG